MNITELKERKRTLAMAADALSASSQDIIKLGIDPDGDWYQAHLFDIQNRLFDLWSEASDDLARAESEAPRQAAEARLAHHIDTDTLDLY